MTLMKTVNDLCRGYLESAKQKGSSEVNTLLQDLKIYISYEAIQDNLFVEAIVNDCQGLGIKKEANICSENGIANIKW